MKKLQLCILFAVCFTFSINVNAQKEKKEHSRSNYIDLNVGSTMLGGGFQGYGTGSGLPGYWTETISPIHFDIGYRRMYNANFGFKLGFAYDEAKEADASRKFKANYYSLDLQAVVNISNALQSRDKFRKWGVVGHAGFGYTGAKLDPKLSAYPHKNKMDNIVNGIAGVYLAYRIGKNWDLHADYSMRFLGLVDRDLDGRQGNHGRIDGYITNLSIGTSINVGKNKNNYDWMTDGETQTDLGEDEKDYDAALADLMVGMSDLQDQVNQLGQNVTDQPTPTMELNLLKSLFDEQLVYAFFDFNDSEPNASSNQAFVIAVKYLTSVPGSRLLLTGYADKIGSNPYNDELAMRRAQRCKSILEELGIDGSRISVKSDGTDMGHPNANSEGARQVVRRVEFNLQ